jgi:hypothetical protein
LFLPNTPTCFFPKPQFVFAQSPNLYSPNTPTWFCPKPQFLFAQLSECCQCQLPVMTSDTVTPSTGRLAVPSCADILTLIDSKHELTVILRSLMSHLPIVTVSQSRILKSSATTL